MSAYKIPESVLVVVYTPALEVLLLQRADCAEAYWQSVTGSRKTRHESLAGTAVREVREETGIDARAHGHALRDWQVRNRYPLDPRWADRFAPGVNHNVEHVYGLCVSAPCAVSLNPSEHVDWCWLPWDVAALRCTSSTNAQACRHLPDMAAAEDRGDK